MTHTPGPWTHSRGSNTVDIAGEAYCYIVTQEDGLPHAQDEADAQLISAAPEMYDALNYLLGALGASPDRKGVLKQVPDAIAAARAAIAKAKGTAE